MFLFVSSGRKSSFPRWKRRLPTAAQHTLEVAAGCLSRRRPARTRNRRRLSAPPPAVCPAAVQHAREVAASCLPQPPASTHVKSLPRCLPLPQPSMYSRPPCYLPRPAGQHARQVADALSAPAAASMYSRPPCYLPPPPPSNAWGHCRAFWPPLPNTRSISKILIRLLFVRASCNMGTPPTRFNSISSIWCITHTHFWCPTNRVVSGAGLRDRIRTNHALILLALKFVFA
jgi:hypothetical protein